MARTSAQLPRRFSLQPGRRQLRGAGFLNETYMELKKVTWPSREEATRLTMMVILISAAVGTALGIIDTLFAEGLAVTLLR